MVFIGILLRFTVYGRPKTFISWCFEDRIRGIYAHLAVMKNNFEGHYNFSRLPSETI